MNNGELTSQLRELRFQLKWAHAIMKQMKRCTFSQDGTLLHLFIQKTTEANNHMSNFCMSIDDILNEHADIGNDAAAAAVVNGDDTGIGVSGELWVDVENVKLEINDRLLASTTDVVKEVEELSTSNESENSIQLLDVSRFDGNESTEVDLLELGNSPEQDVPGNEIELLGNNDTFDQVNVTSYWEDQVRTVGEVDDFLVPVGIFDDLDNDNFDNTLQEKLNTNGPISETIGNNNIQKYPESPIDNSLNQYESPKILAMNKEYVVALKRANSFCNCALRSTQRKGIKRPANSGKKIVLYAKEESPKCEMSISLPIRTCGRSVLIDFQDDKFTYSYVCGERRHVVMCTFAESTELISEGNDIYNSEVDDDCKEDEDEDDVMVGGVMGTTRMRKRMRIEDENEEGDNDEDAECNSRECEDEGNSGNWG